MLEDVGERPPGHLVVGEVVAELAELVEHEVVGIGGQRVARVVDLLDVALRADRADHVLGRVRAPRVEPVEALLAHALGQDRDAARRHDAADRDAAAGVVAGARPDRPVAGRVELPADDARGEAGVRGEHLVRGDHREAVAEDDDDRALDPGQLAGQHDVIGHRDPAAVEVVVPVHAEQVARIGVGVADAVGAGGIEGRRIGELGERRQLDALLAEPLDAVGQRLRVEHGVGQPELVGEGVVGRRRHDLESGPERADSTRRSLTKSHLRIIRLP